MIVMQLPNLVILWVKAFKDFLGEIFLKVAKRVVG